MQIVNGLENIPTGRSSLVTIGSFDGLHLGHQRILRRMKADERGHITVLTFSPHPQSVVRPDLQAPPLITDFSERRRLFQRYGVNRLVLAKFDLDFARLSPQEYVQQVLVERLGAVKVFVGPNHQFGRGRQGDSKLLESLGREHGFQVEIVEPVTIQNEVISSSRIRRHISAGEVLTGFRFLGRPYSISGIVVHGQGRGRKLGFPTANFGDIDTEKLQPPPGIYATVTEIDRRRFYSVSHFGPRPTFDGIGPALETHILGFDEDIYGREIRVGLVDKIRDIVAFEGVDSLIKQMELDRRAAAQRLLAAGFSPGARLNGRRIGAFRN